MAIQNGIREPTVSLPVSTLATASLPRPPLASKFEELRQFESGSIWPRLSSVARPRPSSASSGLRRQEEAHNEPHHDGLGWESPLQRLEASAGMPDMHVDQDQFWALSRARGLSSYEPIALQRLWAAVRELQSELREHERILQQQPSVTVGNSNDSQKDLEWRLRQAIDERFEAHFRETADQSTLVCDRMEAENRTTNAHCTALEDTVRQVKQDVGAFGRLQTAVDHLTSRLVSAETQSAALEGRLRETDTRLHAALIEELRKRDSDVSNVNDQLHKRIDASEARLRHDVTLVEGSIADQLRKTAAEVQQRVSVGLSQTSERWDQLKERVDEQSNAAARQELERLEWERRLGAIEIDTEVPRRSLQRLEDELHRSISSTEQRVVAIEKDLETMSRRSSDSMRLATEGATAGERLEARALEINSRTDSLTGAVAELQRRLSEVDSGLEASSRQHAKVSEGLARLAEEQKSTTQVAADAAGSFRKVEGRLDEIVTSVASTMRQCAEQTAGELKEQTARRFSEIDDWKERMRNSIETLQLKSRSLESTLCDRMDAADSQRATDAEAARSQLLGRMNELDRRMEQMASGLETDLTQMVIKHCGERVDNLSKSTQQQLQQMEAKYKEEAAAESKEIIRRVQRTEDAFKDELDRQSQRLDDFHKRSGDMNALSKQASERQTNVEERLHTLETGLGAVTRAKAEAEVRLEEVRSTLQAATVQNHKTTEALKNLKEEHDATTQTASGALAAIRDIDTRTSKLLKALETSVQEQCDHLGVELQTQNQRNTLALQHRLDGITGDLHDKLASMEKKVARESEEARTALEVGKTSKKVAEDALAVAQRVEQKQRADTRPSEAELKSALDGMESQLQRSCIELQSSLSNLSQRVEDVMGDAQRAGEEAGRSAGRTTAEKASLQAQKVEGKLHDLELKQTSLGETCRKQLERLSREAADVTDGLRHRIDSALDTTAELRTMSQALSQQVERISDDSKRGFSDAQGLSHVSDDISLVVERAEARLAEVEKRRWTVTESLRQQVEATNKDIHVQLSSVRKQADTTVMRVARMEVNMLQTDTALARVERQLQMKTDEWALTTKTIAERADDLQAGMHETQSDVAGIFAVFQKT